LLRRRKTARVGPGYVAAQASSMAPGASLH
jgi:hypothetical protein